MQTLLLWGAGLFFSHIVSGYMQERLFGIKGYTFGFFLTLVRYVINALLAFAYLKLFDTARQMRLFNQFFVIDDEQGNSRSDGLLPQPMQDVESGSKGSDPYEGHHNNNRSSNTGHGGDLHSERSFAKSSSATVPLKDYLLLSFLSVMALGLSTSALAFLNYPTKVIIKTSKLVVIMMFSRSILGKKHSSSEYAMAVSMVVGLVLFTLGDYYVTSDSQLAEGSTTKHSEAESFEWRTTKGVFLLLLSLIFEAININMQKKMLVVYEHSTPAELVFYNAFFGSLVTFLIVLLDGELFTAWQFVSAYPVCHVYILGFSFFSSLGVGCAIMVLHHFDPMTIGIVVTARKSVTILASFILIPKPISTHHITGGMMVFLSLFVSTLWKSQEGAGKTKEFALD